MDPRSAAHVLSQIGALLELRGENKFKSRAYSVAAKAVLGLDTDDISPLYHSGALKKVVGVGPATLAVLADLVETGDSRYLEQLREDTPGGLAEMLRIPGLGTAKIHLIHERLGVETLQQLEDAARDGRLAQLPRFGARTAEKILKGIGFLRETGSHLLFPHALAESRRLLAGIVRHPGVSDAAVAGSVRRHREVVRDIDVVAACESPEAVASSMARAPGVREVTGGGGSSLAIRYVDGTLLDLHCVTPDRFAVALWRATGSEEHVRDLTARAAALGFTIDDDSLRAADGRVVPLAAESDLYRALGCAAVPPELREGSGEVEAAAAGTLPRLLRMEDIRGVLHCHSDYSDGGNTIAELAAAARERGWSYIGVSDHSVSAFYAGGLSRDAVLRQHDEIDAVNESSSDVRVLKGIEADILADGRVDYDAEILDRFDYVIGSIHSRFAMNEREMTARVLRALEDPHLTILGHPTGRLLLTREPYAIDLEAVIEKAAETGVVLELNADPHRLDLDWRVCRAARERGVLIEIGPDAHSIRGLDCTEIGVGMARKGWLEARDVLNTRPVDEVLAIAARRRAPAAGKGGKSGKGGKGGSGGTRGTRGARTAVATKRVRGALHNRKARPLRKGAALRAHAAGIVARLEREYPDAHCELDFGSPLELLVATILSAQCTDKRVNLVTPALFAAYPGAPALAAAPRERLEEMIKSTGFFRNKTKSISGMANALVERHGGEVPATMAELVELPGVGRKTANVVLGNAFGVNEGIVVDTHVGRLAIRLGFTGETDPIKVEQALIPLVPREKWALLSHLLIWHGRRVCDARRPRCEACVLNDVCPSSSV